ncbi:MAG: hypothetical protein EBQ54_04715 [Actinobacteria bacterium]|nr:hypothetical protein [Actinomycetota bacterium]
MPESFSESLQRLSAKISYQFSDITLLETAMRHSSWTAENDGYESNERLEFLGDSLIGFVVADVMYRRYPDFDEGKLTDLRKIVVNSTALSRVAIDLGVGEFVCSVVAKKRVAVEPKLRSWRMRLKPFLVPFI